MRLLRTLRGIISTALVWAVCWTPAGMAVWTLELLLLGGGHIPPNWWATVAGFCALQGATGGALFASVLALAERRQTVDTLRPARLAVWGALAAVAGPVTSLLVVHFRHPEVHLGAIPLVGTAVAGMLGAGYGSLTLVAARHGRPLLDEPARATLAAGNLTSS